MIQLESEKRRKSEGHDDAAQQGREGVVTSQGGDVEQGVVTSQGGNFVG
jgi:hypothetical protein